MTLSFNPGDTALPFRLQTTPAEAVAHPSWARARTIALGVLAKGGSVAVLGRPGTGKTLLLQSLAQALREQGLRVARLEGSGVGDPAADADVVLVDATGDLTEARLAALRVPFAIAALPEFAARLVGLRDVTAVTLEPLSPEEVARFIVGRLSDGGRRRDLFDAEAVLAVARQSAGLLRLVVMLAGAAMFLAEQEGAERVTRAHVDEAAALRLGLVETAAPEPSPVRLAPEPADPPPAPRRPPARRYHRAAPIVVAALAAVTLWAAFGRPPPPPPRASSPAPPASSSPPSPATPLPLASPPARPAPAPAASAVAPAPVLPAEPAVATFRGPVMNETMHQGGQLMLVIHRRPGSDAVTIEFQASSGLIGAGELTGTESADGRVEAAGRLLMGRNPFDCSLEARLAGDTLSGAATFTRAGGSWAARSSFRLARRG